MRLLLVLAQLGMIWLPLAFAVCLIGFAFHIGNSAPAIQGSVIVLVVALYKAIEWGVTSRTKATRDLATEADVPGRGGRTDKRHLP